MGQGRSPGRPAGVAGGGGTVAGHGMKETALLFPFFFFFLFPFSFLISLTSCPSIHLSK
jgi:hypothetical protein